MKQASQQVAKYLSLFLLTATASSVYAETLPNNVNLGTEIGSLGYGAFADWQVNDTIQLKTGYTGGTIKLKDIRVYDLLDFDVKPTFKTPYVTMQYRPLNNWLTVNTGVAYIGNNTINAVSTPSMNTKFEADGQEYIVKTDGRIEAHVKFNNKVLPYMTLGANKEINDNIGLFAEVGAGYTGGYKVNIDLDGSYVKSEEINNAQYDPNNDLTDEESEELANKIATIIDDKLEGRVKSSKLYPMIKAGATFKF